MNRYYCSGSDMSADLKRVVRRVRENKPEYFAPIKESQTSMDGDGKVTTTERFATRATPMSGARRHALSFQTERI